MTEHPRALVPAKQRPRRGELSVLVAEDDPDIRDLIAMKLRACGHTVHTSVGGPSAADLMRRHHPDVVVLDSVVAQRYGSTREVLHRIRASAPGRTPVVVVSADARTEDAVEALRMGADDYLTKPFSPRELAARVERLGARGPRR